MSGVPDDILGYHEQLDDEALRRWLAKARDLQWNYRDIRRNRGLEPLRGVGS